ncbi:hypothetical protein BJY52DRAFT_1271146 [Lactarius psammicola]|nr:hypothetical protein BJY52DRAFT_1271146 [Lactarius psammicola]
MAPNSKMICRSPSPPEADDGEEEWPVYGVVGEDVDVFGISSYEIRWQNWSRPDGTSTTWMRDVEGESTLVESWNDSLQTQRLQKAVESQSIDITLLASTPMHDRLTFERSEAVKEKMDERLRRAGPGTLYQGWMVEIDKQVAQHESERGEKSSSANPKRLRIQPLGREGSYTGSSRLVPSREQRTPLMQSSGRELPPFVEGDDDDLGSTTAPGRLTPRN